MYRSMDYPKHIFKAYDIRGIYPKELNEDVVQSIAESLARFFVSKKRTSSQPAAIILGHDVRLSSPRLYRSALAGLRHKGIRVIQAGRITTPMLYFLVNDLKADGGVIITASHNPKNYNGLKIVGKKAVPISGEEIYAMMTSS